MDCPHTRAPGDTRSSRSESGTCRMGKCFSLSRSLPSSLSAAISLKFRLISIHFVSQPLSAMVKMSATEEPSHSATPTSNAQPLSSFGEGISLTETHYPLGCYQAGTWRRLALCDKPLAPEECKTDGHGKAGHAHCYIDQVCTLQMPNQLTPIIRCPYCQVGNEFLTMLERVEGWFQCDICGHNAMPLDPEFRCSCSKCAASRSPRFPALW